jgi:flagellar basal body-associated protein FliL
MSTKKQKEPPPMSHGPKQKREEKLLRLIKILCLVNVLLVVMFGTFMVAVAIKPEQPIVVDKDTGEVIGEYMTTAFRTNTELIGGAKRFAQYHLSFNSATVYEDFAAALNMMSDKLRERRIQYLKESNLARDIKSASSTSHLVFTTEKILEEKGPYAKVEMAGDLVIGNRNTTSAETLVIRKKVPFRLVADLKMVPVTPTNTAGIKVVDYFEFK